MFASPLRAGKCEPHHSLDRVGGHIPEFKIPGRSFYELIYCKADGLEIAPSPCDKVILVTNPDWRHVGLRLIIPGFINHLRYATPAALAIVCLTACTTTSYYIQSIGGHLDLISNSRPISGLTIANGLGSGRKEKLRLVLRIRDFASGVMLLPENDSYRSYTEIDRPFSTWSVVAARRVFP